MGNTEISMQNMGAFMLRHGQFYFVKCVRPSTPLNNSSETTGPVFFKFLLEPSVNGGIENLYK